MNDNVVKCQQSSDSPALPTVFPLPPERSNFFIFREYFQSFGTASNNVPDPETIVLVSRCEPTVEYSPKTADFGVFDRLWSE